MIFFNCQQFVSHYLVDNGLPLPLWVGIGHQLTCSVCGKLFFLDQNNSNLRNRIRTSMAVGVAYCLDPMDIGQVTNTRGKAGRVSRLANSNAACFPVIALPWLLIGQDHLDFMPVVLWRIGQFGRSMQAQSVVLELQIEWARLLEPKMRPWLQQVEKVKLSWPTHIRMQSTSNTFKQFIADEYLRIFNS